MIDIYEYIKKEKALRQTHLDLSMPCIERGGNSRECRGLLADFLDTSIPKGMKIHACHACHNAKCNNSKHLYWGTSKENMDDSGFHELARQSNLGRAPWNKGKTGYKNPRKIKQSGTVTAC